MIYEVEVTTWCSEKREMVRLTLENNEPFKGEIVKGKPVFCRKQLTCDKKGAERCFLNAIAIETKRC